MAVNVTSPAGTSPRAPGAMSRSRVGGGASARAIPARPTRTAMAASRNIGWPSILGQPLSWTRDRPTARRDSVHARAQNCFATRSSHTSAIPLPQRNVDRMMTGHEYPARRNAMTPTRREFLVASSVCAVAGQTRADSPAPDVKLPPFKLGMVTYNVASQWDLPTILKVCKALGIAAVECRTTHKHGVEPSLSAEQRSEVRKRFADSGVVFWGCGSVCEFHSPDADEVKKQIQTCRQFVELVHDLGGTGVKVRPNGLPKGVAAEKTLEQIGKALAECGTIAEGFGVEIWVEVHGAGTQEPANMKTIMDRCGHKSVGVTWNSNATDVKDGSVTAAFEQLKPWIKS